MLRLLRPKKERLGTVKFSGGFTTLYQSGTGAVGGPVYNGQTMTCIYAEGGNEMSWIMLDLSKLKTSLRLL